MSAHPSLDVSGGALHTYLPGFTTVDCPYDPYPLVCSNSHVETIFANKLRSTPYFRFQRECLRTSDNDVVSLDWVVGDNHNLSPRVDREKWGVIHKAYAIESKKQRLASCGFYSRGCPVITPKFYSASFTGDIGEVVVELSSRYPDANLYATGWSLGANILVRYLAQEGESCLLSGAVSLGNPFNLALADEGFQTGLQKVYDKVLGASLSRIFRRHALLFEEIEGDYNIPAALNSKSVREFHHSLTQVDDYYLNASSANSIKHVCTPLLCIQAANDPIAPVRAIPHEDIKENPKCMLIVTPKGSHLAWVAGIEAPFGAPWTDPVVMEFLEHLEKTK